MSGYTYQQVIGEVVDIKEGCSLNYIPILPNSVIGRTSDKRSVSEVEGVLSIEGVKIGTVDCETGLLAIDDDSISMISFSYEYNADEWLTGCQGF